MTNVHIVKAMVFPVVMYGCESWTRKQAEHRRTGASKLWCWRRLESPLDCKEIQPVIPKGNQSWIFIRRTDAEAEASKHVKQRAKHLKQRADSLEKALMLGKMKGRRIRGWQSTRWFDGIMTQWTWIWETSGRWWRTGKPGMLQSMELQRVGHDWVTE